jgi:hypothetical protein
MIRYKMKKLAVALTGIGLTISVGNAAGMVLLI